MPLIKLGRDQAARLRALDAEKGSRVLTTASPCSTTVTRVVWLSPAITADFAYRDGTGTVCYGRAPREWLEEVRK